MVCISFVSHAGYLSTRGGAVIRSTLFIHEQMSRPSVLISGKTALRAGRKSDIMTSHTGKVRGMAKVKQPKAKDAQEDEKKNTSLRLSGKTLKALKLRAIEEDTSVQKIVETLIEDYLRKSRKKVR
ncbi:hypothetical protein [Alloyangia pacifica]|uniref:hypothetical protein n=1 Tax=Alloyangia pacifica TaxID=311180 RepID=UPI0031E0E221